MTEQHEFEIDTRRLLQGVLKKSWLIGLVALVCAGAVLLGGVLLTDETYRAQVTFCVDTGAEHPTSQSISAARDLADSCGVLLHSQSCLKAVSDTAKTEVTAGMLTGSAVDGTEFFRVTVRADSAERAQEIVAAVEQILPQLAQEYLSGAQLKVVDPAGAAARQTPAYFSLAATGFLLGLVVSTAVVALVEIKRNR